MAGQSRSLSGQPCRQRAGADSIRDVIAFPKVKDASCLMTEAPSPVDVKQLQELGIEVSEEETQEENSEK